MVGMVVIDEGDASKDLKWEGCEYLSEWKEVLKGRMWGVVVEYSGRYSVD